MSYVNYRVKFSVEIPGLSTAGAREIENSRVPHQVVTAQVLSSVCSQIPRASDLSSRDKIPLDQQLCKRVCRGLKTGAIEHNFVRLTKEQVSSGGFSLLCAAQCPDPSHHNTLSAERRADQSILKFKQPVDAQLLQ